MSAEWTEVDINSPIDPNALEAIKELVEGLGGGIEYALEATKLALEVSKLYILTTIDPNLALQVALAREIDSIVGGLQDAGVGVAFIPPELGNLKPLNTNLEKLATSVRDIYDKQRPIASGASGVQVFLYVLTVRASGPDDLIDFWNNLMSLLFDFSAFEFRQRKEIGAPPDIANGHAQMPNWSSVKLPEALPVIGEVLEVLRTLTRALVDISVIETDLIDSLIVLIDAKISKINLLLTQLDAIIQKLTTLEGLAENGLDILAIEGTYNQNSLSAEINAARGNIPNDTGTDVSALIAFYTTTPTVGPILRSFFTGG